MPSLMPGVAGAKEVYGISILRDDYSIIVPPAAIKNYDLFDGTKVIFSTTHRGEGGLAVLNRSRAEASVFKKIVIMIKEANRVYWHNDKAYALSTIKGNTVKLNAELAEAFNLELGEELMSVKGATIAVSFIPVGIWKQKFLQRGLQEAVDNISKLEIFT